jgi:hypothetical protein
VRGRCFIIRALDEGGPQTAGRSRTLSAYVGFIVLICAGFGLIEPQKLWQALASLLCAVVTLKQFANLEGTEFSGGRITGPLLDMYDLAIILFMANILVTFFYPRVAAAIFLVAASLCLPLYLYSVAPGPFRRVFRGEYSVPLQANFVLNEWLLGGMLVLAFLAYVSLCSFRLLSPNRVANSDKRAHLPPLFHDGNLHRIR